MKENTNYFLAGVSAVFSAIQSNEVLQWISWGLTLLCTLLSIAFTIWKWWDKAHADGRITPDELKELQESLQDEKEKIDQNGSKED